MLPGNRFNPKAVCADPALYEQLKGLDWDAKNGAKHDPTAPVVLPLVLGNGVDATLRLWPGGKWSLGYEGGGLQGKGVTGEPHLLKLTANLWLTQDSIVLKQGIWHAWSSPDPEAWAKIQEWAGRWLV